MTDFATALAALLTSATPDDIAEAVRRLSVPPASLPTPPPVAPASPAFDLRLWKLTLPVDSKGGFSGEATETAASPPARPPHFIAAADGSMQFTAPVDGARTSGSKYPRCELREMAADGDEADWTLAQGGTLSATLAVNEVPMTAAGSPGRVVIGQIHGPDDELCRLYYDKGTLYFYDDKAGAKKVETSFTLKSPAGRPTAIPLGARFDYTIQANAKALTVTAFHDGVTYTATDPISAFWPGRRLYFKAGLYLGVGKPGSGAGTTGHGQGRVSFYRLAGPSHP